ncbi:MAG TPA: hypothetical protein VK831_01350 [Candidatus Deferrimicrobiaceae bacterium]|nr:hypothetical protein [Candidatus Deferrimicrobiaceae bacterium]
MRSLLQARGVGLALTSAIVLLTLVTASVHLSLGGLLFLLNGLGYLGLAVLIVVGYLKPHPLVERFDWAPRLALMGYAATTIVGYIVIGPYSTLGWATKAVEVVLIGLLSADVIRVYGGPRGVVQKMIASVFGRPRQEQPRSAAGAASTAGTTTPEPS